MKRLLVLLCIGTLVLSGWSDAQSLVAPNANWTQAATGGLNSLTREAARTVQQGIDASELTSLPVGAVITGLSFRQRSAATTTWPASTATWKNFEITLAEGAVPTSMWTSTFASNMKNPVMVRKGPLVMPTATFGIASPAPHPFDTFYFDFQQPYVYQGGDLVFFITHDGNDISSNTYLEGVPSSSTKPGRTMYASSYQATTATTTNTTFMTVQIHYGFGPAGCMGAKGVVNLILSHELTGPTPPPGTINIAVTNGPSNSSGLMVVAYAQAPSPIPLPGGCYLLIVPPFVGFIPVLLDGNGRMDLNLPFPAAAVGAVVAQAYVVDTAVPSGFVVTNGISLKIGP